VLTEARKSVSCLKNCSRKSVITDPRSRVTQGPCRRFATDQTGRDSSTGTKSCDARRNYSDVLKEALAARWKQNLKGEPTDHQWNRTVLVQPAARHSFNNLSVTHHRRASCVRARGDLADHPAGRKSCSRKPAVKPENIAWLWRPGARGDGSKLSAYDYTDYGTPQGTVKLISG